MHQELIRREFNRWAEEGRGRGMEKTHWEITRQMIDLMNVDAHDNVVDLGCGVGWATRVLAQKASRGVVLGIDLSDRMIVQARTGYRNPHNALFLVADASGIPCPEGFLSYQLLQRKHLRPRMGEAHRYSCSLAWNGRLRGGAQEDWIYDGQPPE